MRKSIGLSVILATSFLSLFSMVGIAATPAAAEPTCAVVVGPDTRPGLETQKSRISFRIDDVFFRDFLAEAKIPDPLTGLPAQKLSFWERQKAIATALGMLAIHPNHEAAAKSDKAGTIFLAIEIGDALDGSGGAWTSRQRIGLKYTWDADEKVYSLQRVSLINKNADKDGEGITLIDHPLKADLSAFKAGSREIIWNNYIDRSQKVVSLDDSAVSGSQANLMAQKLRFDSEFDVPTVLSKSIGDSLTNRAKWISEIQNEFLQNKAFESDSWVKQKAFYLVYKSYGALINLPGSILSTSGKLLAPAVLAGVVAIHHHPSWNTVEEVAIHLFNVAKASQSASTVPIGTGVSKDDYRNLVSQYVDPSERKGLDAKSESGDKVQSSPQDVMTKFVASLEAMENENLIAGAAAQSKMTQLNSRKSVGNTSTAANVGEIHDVIILTRTHDGLPAKLHIMQFPESEKILLSIVPDNASTPSSFAIITKDSDPLTYQKLLNRQAGEQQ